MILNIFSNYYTDNPLGISGPKLFGKFIKKNIDLENNIPSNNNWKLSYITDKNKKIIIKNSYNGYYEENNYLETEHYSVKWHNRNIYLEIPIDYNKINFIKHIVWINLDRSPDRKDYMEKILYNINIPSTRISAIDGREEPVREFIKPHVTSITDYEIACSLSHVKCINYLYELETTTYNNGENNYYIVCEDDISFNTLNLFNFDLGKIINDYSDFDILLISKIYHKELVSKYTDWNIEFNKGGDNHIAGTAFYIISSEGIKKSIENFMYKENLFTINKPIEVADKMIYRDLKTYVFKYNYVGTLDNNSTIHSEHVEWHKKCSDIQNMISIKNNILIN
jgi:GR25 family glycosyltransferase involved in LPS biosynthesis